MAGPERVAVITGASSGIGEATARGLAREGFKLVLGAGLQPLAEGNDDDWVQMMETNVLGLLRVTRAILPLLRRAPRAHIVNLGSVAGFEVYPGGVGYTASKHAV